MQLSARLNAIADMVTEGHRLVDVGCDHGFLPVFLVLNGRIPSAIAADVRPGPLSRAEEHIREYHLQEQIQTRLSDGLEKIHPGEGETLVIAGMGGGLMRRILEGNRETRESFEEYILAPQSDVPMFREYLLEQNLRIVEEKMILEDGKFYPVLRALKSSEPAEAYSEAELHFGKLLLKEKNPVLRKYLSREQRICREIEEQLEGKSGEAVEIRRNEVRKEAALVEAAIRVYESEGLSSMAE